MQTLNQTVVASGRVFPQGTARKDAEGVPDGPWWDGAPEAAPAGKQGSSKATKTRTSRQQADSDES